MMNMSAVCAASRFRNSPAQLFQDGTVGAWYDPSDLSTLFQDASGTIPVTSAGQSVALMLDKSRGLSLGPELAVNGGFDADSGWTKGSGWSISGGRAVRVPSSSGSTISQAATLASGRFYKVEFDFYNVTGTVYATLRGGTAVPSTVSTFSGQSGRFSCILLSTGNTSFDISASDANTTGSYDNYSIRELIGFHAVQPTAACRPTLQIEDGRPYLQFDGVDDRFNITTPNSADLTFTSKTLFIGLNHTSAIASGTRVFFGRGIGNWYLGLGSGRLLSSHSNAAAGQRAIYHGSVINTNFPYVVTCGWVVDGQNVTVFGRQNGELKTPSVAMPLTDGISLNGSSTWALGSFTQAGASTIPAHRFYGFVLHGAQSSAAQIAATERWLAAKVGATLG